MPTRHLWLHLVAVLTLWLALMAPPLPPARAAEEKPLGAARHERRGIACAGCHAESPPRQKVSTARCLACHGDYPSLAKRTAAVSPNPHAPTPHSTPASMPPCEDCHHMHKPSQDSCLACHDTFNYKTP